MVSGTDVTRPKGQLKPAEASPVCMPCKLCDFELEMVVLVGVGNTLGDTVPVDNAGGHIFGMVRYASLFRTSFVCHC